MKSFLAAMCLLCILLPSSAVSLSGLMPVSMRCSVTYSPPLLALAAIVLLLMLNIPPKFRYLNASYARAHRWK